MTAGLRIALVNNSDRPNGMRTELRNLSDDFLLHCARRLHKVALALVEALALLIFVGVHRAVDFLMTSYVIPMGWDVPKVIMKVVLLAGFSVIYVHQIWEMVRVFVPSHRKSSDFIR